MLLKPKTDINQLFHETRSENKYLKICSPMVRYSKLQFRTLVRRFGVDLTFTPMILADSFCQSSKARHNEFSTSATDTPLIVQFAAKTVHDFVGASELVYPYADGVDLNCGCPQRWAIKDGYGCGLLSKPEVVHSLIREFKNRLPSSFSVSVKVRLLKDLKSTIEMCRQLERCDVSFLSVHGRTATQKTSEPVDMETLRDIRDLTQVYFVANGDVKTLQDADEMHLRTNCDGVMAARGMLSNPALFNGDEKTPLDCVQQWLNISRLYRDEMIYQCYHHHLVFMLEKILPRRLKRVFNNLNSYTKIDDFIEEHYGLRPQFETVADEIICDYDPTDYKILKNLFCEICMNKSNQCKCYADTYDSRKTNGKFFEETILKNDDVCDLDHMDGSLFD